MEKMEMDGWMGGCRIYGRLKTYCVTEIDTLLCFLQMGWGIHTPVGNCSRSVHFMSSILVSISTDI
jgi:hypothetical protein